MLVQLCTSKVPACRTAICASVENSDVCASAVANAHAAFAKSCALKSHKHCSSAPAKATNSLTSDRAAVANDHAVFTSSCALNSCICYSTTVASAADSTVRD
eukprot:gnl/TRDRNA2_/TRDRNA2_152918_c1_seq4.p3 gnl/TRDRNA2_/TRDRNA2_152918_c1~~gnl/TRDRNA2_/TRDRNA2_152918_c1_seq4.p3  ORF type:complete len:102 (-),score=8.63 gnl/TRDRNA2_/TRDRNA2_152918_c1_seq4:148-453(-)